ncbi:unnamed protein product [Diabrotica balteata]|uniref:tRNA (guanine(37)-N1)-methyltransferase n=1 Tax=Diabrotica balteata TaxID=107213 RepID=A0A9P0GV43_DIABA|nr:unnamed protein product [Diabrotica balteata]
MIYNFHKQVHNCVKNLSYLLSHQFYSTQLKSAMENILKPPNIRGMQVLNKDLIKKDIEVPYLSLKKENLNKVLPILTKHLLKIKKFKPVEHIEENKVDVCLSPEFIKDWTGLPDEVKSVLEEVHINKNDLKTKHIELTYDNFSAEDLLKAVLPTEKDGLSSFSQMGHIVHINLREHLVPFKSIIADILYDKIPGCKSVVNKINVIDNTYRNFSMEVLKGDNNMITTVKENACSFKFDFSKVYWNSRLCTEHERVVKKIKSSDVLFDVFAGIGPFSIPAAKKKCYVYANDLNPESFKWLEYNSKANKVPVDYFKSFNKDGADFIKTDFKQFLTAHLKNEQNVFITMNLPAMAVEFLKYFEGLFSNGELPDFKNIPIIFVYCFVKGENYIELGRKLVLDHFNCSNSDIVDIFRVRTVSNFKEMMRVTIKLQKNILTGNQGKRKLEEDFNQDTKRSCVTEQDGKEQEESR